MSSLHIVSVYLVRLSDFPCGGYDKRYKLIDSYVLDFRVCTNFTILV